MRETPYSAPREGGNRSDLRTLGRLLPYLWPSDDGALKARVLVALGLLGLENLTKVGVPYLYKQAVDALSEPADALIVVPVMLIVAYGAARFLQSAFSELQDLVFAKVTQRATRRLGLETFQHLHALPLRFHLDRQTGSLTRLIERGAGSVQTLLRLVVFRTAPTIIELALVSAILWSLFDWRFAAVNLLTVLIYAVYTVAITNWRLKFRRIMNESDQDLGRKTVDSLLNYETVKYFNNEKHEAHRFDGSLQNYEKAALRSATSLSALNIGQRVIITVGLVVVMVMAGVGVQNGTMTVGDFVMVNTYLLQLAMPLNMFGMMYREIKQAIIDMDAMFSLLDETPEIQDKPNAKPLVTHGGEVRFEDVRFGYSPDKEILHGLSFVVPPGRMVAIVGASGAGKSTLSKLLFRFYDVTGGRITIDGQDLRDVTQDSVRANIGVVPQDTVLFNDTIAYNIAYGRPDAPPEAVEEAARLAAVHGFVMTLPDKYDTVVGERGLKLSGGEKQRVAIARTILKRPAVLLFDEATSALDTHTEREIQAALRQVAANRTTLVIAHRLSTIVDADEILVMDAGTIIERGRHGELLAHGGRYAEMWHRQLEGDATGTVGIGA